MVRRQRIEVVEGLLGMLGALNLNPIHAASGLSPNPALLISLRKSALRGWSNM